MVSSLVDTDLLFFLLPAVFPRYGKTFSVNNRQVTPMFATSQLIQKKKVCAFTFLWLIGDGKSEKRNFPSPIINAIFSK